MTIKNVSFFSLLLMTSFIGAKKKVASEFQTKLDTFNQKTVEYEKAWLHAKEECEEADNCDIHEKFQQLSAEVEVIATKIRLIEDAKALHARAEKFGIEGVFNKQRAIKKIIDR